MARRFPALILVVLAFAATVAAGAVPPKKSHQKKAAVVQPAPEPSPTPAPPPLLTPEQGPSYPPEVTFQSGQLTIVARNSTMVDVLTAVKQKTGAAVDMPASSGERVVGRFGPGSPRDVMAQLLNGSHYDYVLLGSPSDPGALRKVVLMARVNGPAMALPPSQGNQAAQDNNQDLQAVPDIVSDDQDNNAEMPEAPEQEEPQPDQQQQPDANGPAVKTPEQLLQELRQQQQQQPQQQPPQQDPPQQ